MMTLLSLAGIVVAVVVFLNLLQARDRLERGPLPASVLADGEQRDRAGRSERILRSAPDRRICPVCKTGLTREEYLICAMDAERGASQKRQVHIYGCPHCFLTDGVNLSRYDQIHNAVV
ncbi:MAG: hypothetical protein K1X75_11425 [Leptospirales bacterium]|nr:hypothetical protein [Leptospirales bacterium]